MKFQEMFEELKENNDGINWDELSTTTAVTIGLMWNMIATLFPEKCEDYVQITTNNRTDSLGKVVSMEVITQEVCNMYKTDTVQNDDDIKTDEKTKNKEKDLERKMSQELIKAITKLINDNADSLDKKGVKDIEDKIKNYNAALKSDDIDVLKGTHETLSAFFKELVESISEDVEKDNADDTEKDQNQNK